jgi:signal transduction histidine kinase
MNENNSGDAHMIPKSLSLSRRGAWGQVAVAGLLITVLPGLTLLWLWNVHLRDVHYPDSTFWAVGGGIAAVITLGYALLVKYPVSIVRLRQYLMILAGGGIPELVNIAKDEDDLEAVEEYLKQIIKMAEDRIKMLKKQHDLELETERQRVMVESIGTMCHHLGQPAATLSMGLYSLKNNPEPTEVPKIVADCEASFNAMSETLDKLRAISHYCTEAYLSKNPEQTENPVAAPDTNIIAGVTA